MIMCILHMSRVCIKNYSRSVYVIHHGRYPDIKKTTYKRGFDKLPTFVCIYSSNDVRLETECVNTTVVLFSRETNK